MKSCTTREVGMCGIMVIIKGGMEPRDLMNRACDHALIQIIIGFSNGLRPTITGTCASE